MEPQLKLFRVFIASPSDLPEERQSLREIVEKLNAIYSKETELRIELLGWEDTLLGTGRPQELINVDLDKADLFIGCLWQRWGSDSGNGAKTGFEEEFDRSLERRKKTGSPEMWLFFKEVEPVRRSDPGEQLRKVLAFRAREIEAKRMMFKDFPNAAVWRELLSELLQRQMLRLITAKPSSEREAQSTGTPQSKVEADGGAGNSPKSQSKGTSALTSLADLLRTAEHKARAAKLSVFDRSEVLAAHDTVRLLLFAGANYDWNGQHIQLGSHEMNSVYFHRTELDPTALERLFLLRTLLLDDSVTKPGWFWVNEWKLNLKIWLPWFAMLDSEEAMRERAIEFATRVGFPLYKRSKTAEPPIMRLLNDSEASVRIAALKHVAVLGRPVELASVAPLLRDDNKEVRTQAERTTRLIRLRASPDEETHKEIEQRDSFDEELAAEFARNAEKLSGKTLALALDHLSGALRASASKELLKRTPVSAELTKKMCADEAKAVKECGYLARVANGEVFESSELRSALAESYSYYSSDEFWWNKADPNTEISACFERLPADVLWKRVCAFDEDSHLAINAIGRLYFKENAAQIRTELSDDFQARADAMKDLHAKRQPAVHSFLDLSSLFGNLGASIEASRKPVLVSALEILADHPHPIDRELFLKFLSGDPTELWRTVACLRGLSSVGQSNDREKLVPLLSDSMASIQSAAARAYLALSANSVTGAKDLLQAPSEHLVWVVIRHALKSDDRAFWPLIKPLLAHENENIRRLICYYAIRTLTRTAIGKLLNEYLARGRYFYNVVTLLDRALYAPKGAREKYTGEEHEFFEQWRSSATWQWEER